MGPVTEELVERLTKASSPGEVVEALQDSGFEISAEMQIAPVKSVDRASVEEPVPEGIGDDDANSRTGIAEDEQFGGGPDDVVGQGGKDILTEDPMNPAFRMTVIRGSMKKAGKKHRVKPDLEDEDES